MVGKLSLKVETVRSTPALSGCFETTDSEPEKDNSEGEGGELEEGPPPLTESEWSETEDDNTETSENEEVDSCGENSEDIEIECNSCTFKVDIPPELEESDQVLINISSR